MRVFVESAFDCPPETVWDAVQQNGPGSSV